MSEFDSTDDARSRVASPEPDGGRSPWDWLGPGFGGGSVSTTRGALGRTATWPALRPFGGMLRAAVGVGLALLLVDTWLVHGFLVPLIVASNSMAPAIRGPHRAWQCQECGHVFVCSLESLPAPGAAVVCPNCGAKNDPAAGVDRLGDRLFVDRSAFLWRSPRRFETVVFRCPDEARSLCVKRVLGLPGEIIQIQAGDVLVDGVMASKNAAQAQEMAVAVHEVPPLDGRWQSLSNWQAREGHFIHAGPLHQPSAFSGRNKPKKPLDWLVYHHRRRAAASRELEPSAVLDESPSDQNESRQCDPVVDLAVACELQTSGQGDVALRVRSGVDDIDVRIDLETGEGELSQNGQPSALVNASAEPFSRFALLELMVVDHRAVVLLNHKVLTDYEYEPTATSNPAAAGLLTWPADEVAAVGAVGAQVDVRRLAVSRDVYYTSGRGGQAKYRLGPGEYFLLGDNSPHSADSRGWSPSGISDSQLVGSVIRW